MNNSISNPELIGYCIFFTVILEVLFVKFVMRIEKNKLYAHFSEKLNRADNIIKAGEKPVEKKIQKNVAIFSYETETNIHKGQLLFSGNYNKSIPEHVKRVKVFIRDAYRLPTSIKFTLSVQTVESENSYSLDSIVEETQEQAEYFPTIKPVDEVAYA